MFRDTLTLILGLEKRKPAETIPGELDALFETLAAESPKSNAYEVEDLIWEIWTDHPEPLAATMMNRGIEAVARRQYDAAERIFDELVEIQPHWAEAWNKRATLFFLLGHDEKSVHDIHRTLELEPRHFGALSGFAQICLRSGDLAGALVGFEEALRINPHLAAVRETLVELQRTYPSHVH